MWFHTPQSLAHYMHRLKNRSVGLTLNNLKCRCVWHHSPQTVELVYVSSHHSLTNRSVRLNSPQSFFTVHYSFTEGKVPGSVHNHSTLCTIPSQRARCWAPLWTQRRSSCSSFGPRSRCRAGCRTAFAAPTSPSTACATSCASFSGGRVSHRR